MQEEAEHLASVHSGRTMDVLVPFDGISLEWEELKRTLQGCEDSLLVAGRLQSFIQVQGGGQTCRNTHAALAWLMFQGKTTREQQKPYLWLV